MSTIFVALIVCTLLLASSCAQIDKPAIKPYFAETAAPKLQELRWSNGKAPRSLDPAFAAAAPETDVVRAIFEGLTELDAQTLDAVPAVAEKWTASPDSKTWTFELRRDAKWSNGQRVTANDFVKTFQRLAKLGPRGAHRDLLINIVGFRAVKVPNGAMVPDFETAPAQDLKPATDQSAKFRQERPATNTSPESPVEAKPTAPDIAVEFGVVAKGETTLEIKLREPDRDLPKLLANPIFRPVFGSGDEFAASPVVIDIVTNGPFRIASIDRGGLTLARSETYWSKDVVKLDRLVFVHKESADSALDAYRKGDVDVVTNSTFEPLALKLLSPFKDFRQTTHSALNFYEINTNIAPFSDRRVREALAITIDRERVTDGELNGSTQPATRFLPLASKQSSALSLDVEKAKRLIGLAGYPDGASFPKIRLVVNRNDTQQRVARTVGRMWKQHLNIETEIIVKDAAEFEAARIAGEYDMIRRGVVLPTVNETVSLAAILGFEHATGKRELSPKSVVVTDETLETLTPIVTVKPNGSSLLPNETPVATVESTPELIFSEQDAIFELRAIPLYFPTSYSLVKPYVRGFETNGLDSPSLANISIDSDWQTRPTLAEQ